MVERGDLPAECRGYEVRDRDGEKIGKVDEVFVNDEDRPEYLGVKTSLMGGKLTLVPAVLARSDESQRVIQISESKDRIKDGPALGSKEEITSQRESEIRTHFGLDSSGNPPSEPAEDQDQTGDIQEPRSDEPETEEASETGENYQPQDARDNTPAQKVVREARDRESGDRETVRVSVWRERARAEKVLGDDGGQEMRIRKEWVEEEETLEVEDRQGEDPPPDQTR
jgi:hypothetical protein